jgi:two-component system, LytTR family, response regulator
MIKAIIVDDERKSREILSTMLSRYCTGIEVVAAAGNVEEGIAAITAEKPQILFLDISMPDGNGFDLLNKIGETDFEIIFITAYNEYALQAIKARAIDYLLKPLNIKELQLAVQKAAERIEEKQYLIEALQKQQEKKNIATGRLAVPVNDGLQFVSLEQIVRLTAKGSYTEIFSEDNSHVLSSRPLKEYEDMLPANVFFRAHHSHIINLAYIRQYHRGEGGYVTMHDGSVIDISKRKKKDFLNLFS